MTEPPTDEQLVHLQLGRAPRTPWRVVARCDAGFPLAIVSPSLLDDGTPFPTYAWLTCPYLADACGALESAGATSQWAERATHDPLLAEALRRTDAELREARRRESGGEDACATVGLAGQRDALGVKCLHAHVALALSGISDPIGGAVLEQTGTMCPDSRCARLGAGREGGKD